MEKSVLTQRGQTGRGDAYAVFQGGPNEYVHKAPCWIIVIDNSNLTDPND